MRPKQDGRLNPDFTFQSTHSLRSATVEKGARFLFAFVSIHALLAECDFHKCSCPLSSPVSIHALLAECDEDRAELDAFRAVSIHALLAECDAFGLHLLNVFSSFNPRTPCGVRRVVTVTCKHGPGFNPRTPCGVRPLHPKPPLNAMSVSIHALLAECDQASNNLK